MLRYACKYVEHKLLKQYEKKHGDMAVQCVACLGEMAVEGEGSDLLAYTKQWLESVNRGGLFPLSDEAFRLFIEKELCVHRTYLPHHLLRPHSKAGFTESVHDKVVLLDSAVTRYKRFGLLLKEIIKLWVTVKGFSITRCWMEVYKKERTLPTPSIIVHFCVEVWF